MGENKGADQLCSDCQADLHLCSCLCICYAFQSSAVDNIIQPFKNPALLGKLILQDKNIKQTIFFFFFFFFFFASFVTQS